MQFQYILKASHVGRNNVTDELHFNIRSSKDNEESILRVFVVNKHPAALSDGGQSFKTVLYMTRDLNVDSSHLKVLHGCGPHKVKSSATNTRLITLIVAVL